MEAAPCASDGDLQDRHWWFRGRRHAIRTLGLLLVPRGGRIVDVGCGTGAVLASFPGSYVRQGIDASARMVATARANHPGLAFEVGEVPEAGGEAIGAADLVLLCDVLDRVQGDAAFLRSLAFTMKPGAHLLLTVPADPRLWSPDDTASGRLRRYTRDSLVRAWMGAPLQLRLLAPLNHRLYPLARAASAVRPQRRGDGRGEGRDIALPWAPVNAVLERLLAGEATALTAALKTSPREVPGQGLSLLAVLERKLIPVGSDTPTAATAAAR